MNKTEVKIPEMLFFQEGPGVRNTQYTSSGVKLLNVANLVDGKVDLSTSYRYISEDEAYGKYRHFLCDEGDFIVASSGIKVDYIDKKMGFISREMLPLCMNTSTIRFKVLDDSKLNIKYFMYFLKSTAFKKQLAKQITGSAQLNYGPSHLKQMTFPLIDIKIQNDLVQKLDSIMRIIDQKNTSLRKLDELVKARFVEMFDSSKTYPIRPLSDIAEYWNGLTYKPTDVSDGGTIVLRSSNIQNMQLDLDDIVRVKCDISNKKIVKKNDILMCSRNGSAKLVGKVALIPNLPEQMSFGAFMMIIRSEYCQYLMTYFQLPEFRSQISTGTTTINQITRYMLDKVKLPVPDKASIDEFFTFVTQVDKSKFALSNELAMCNFYVRLINDSITHSRIDLRMSE